MCLLCRVAGMRLVVFALCGCLQHVNGHAHTTALRVVNRPHAEYVDRTKISSDFDAIKAESLNW